MRLVYYAYRIYGTGTSAEVVVAGRGRDECDGIARRLDASLIGRTQAMKPLGRTKSFRIPDGMTAEECVERERAKASRGFRLEAPGAGCAEEGEKVA